MSAPSKVDPFTGKTINPFSVAVSMEWLDGGRPKFTVKATKRVGIHQLHTTTHSGSQLCEVIAAVLNDMQEPKS